MAQSERRGARPQPCKRWCRQGRAANEYNGDDCKRCPHIPCAISIAEQALPEYNYPQEWKQSAEADPKMGWEA